MIYLKNDIIKLHYDEHEWRAAYITLLLYKSNFKVVSSFFDTFFEIVLPVKVHNLSRLYFASKTYMYLGETSNMEAKNL